MKLRVVLPVTLVVLGIGGLVVSQVEISQYLRRPQETGDDVPVNPVMQRSTVYSLGRLEPESRLIDVSGPTGARVYQLEVDESQVVQQGEVIAYLDDYPMKKAAKASAAVGLAEAQELFAAESEHGQALVREAQVELRQVRELVPLDIAAKEASIRSLESEVSNAERDLERVEELRSSHTVTEEELEDRRADVVQSQEQLAEARSQLERLQAGQQLDALAIETKIKSIEAATLRAQMATNVRTLSAELELAEAELERTIIRCPVDGTVLKIFTFPGEQISSEPILQMGSCQQMYAVAEVYETDVRFVEIGQRANITSPALSEPLSGEVDNVGLIIAKNDVLDIDPAAPVDARIVEVRIRLDESTAAARYVNLQVRVEIETPNR